LPCAEPGGAKTKKLPGKEEKHASLKNKSITVQNMKLLTLLFSIIFCEAGLANTIVTTYSVNDTPLVVRHCTDFTITGKGESPEWQKTKWVALNKIDKGGKADESKFKILYSTTGLYVLFSGQDEKITSSYKNDFDNLFNADVFEVFFHPNPDEPVYFEYEISPLNKELVLLILNRNGKFGSWIPWHYEDKKKVVKKVTITGGQMKPNASIKSWMVELFFPYQLLNSLMNVPPVSGMRWNANFCRLDYDSGNMIKWSWSPVKVSFHEFEKYFPVQFE
jgi:Carbohydrate family 9 binding domain-like